MQYSSYWLIQTAMQPTSSLSFLLLCLFYLNDPFLPIIPCLMVLKKKKKRSTDVFLSLLDSARSSHQSFLAFVDFLILLFCCLLLPSLPFFSIFSFCLCRTPIAVIKKLVAGMNSLLPLLQFISICLSLKFSNIYKMAHLFKKKKDCSYSCVCFMFVCVYI